MLYLVSFPLPAAKEEVKYENNSTNTWSSKSQSLYLQAITTKTETMWKENLGNYLIDVSKYFLTGVFVTSLIKDMEEVRWLIYVLSGSIAVTALIAGLLLTNKKED